MSGTDLKTDASWEYPAGSTVSQQNKILADNMKMDSRDVLTIINDRESRCWRIFYVSS